MLAAAAWRSFNTLFAHFNPRTKINSEKGKENVQQATQQKDAKTDQQQQQPKKKSPVQTYKKNQITAIILN